MLKLERSVLVSCQFGVRDFISAVSPVSQTTFFIDIFLLNEDIFYLHCLSGSSFFSPFVTMLSDREAVFISALCVMWPALQAVWINPGSCQCVRVVLIIVIFNIQSEVTSLWRGRTTYFACLYDQKFQKFFLLIFKKSTCPEGKKKTTQEFMCGYFFTLLYNCFPAEALTSIKQEKLKLHHAAHHCWV